MTETESLLVLNAVKGLGNSGIRKLLKRYGSASGVLALPEAELLAEPVLSADVLGNILHFSGDKFLETEYNLMNKRQVKALTWLDEGYPALLREIPDAPVILYVKGGLPVRAPLSIAIVGSRRASLYGTSVSQNFATRLAELGITVVSGMARGIDTAAHNGALKALGTTVAVLGCGLNHVYPLENMELFEKIAETGAVISEFPMQMMPFAHNFPRRNRVISGLSSGVVVVEAAERSGALITADFALEQGREVYAVPGKIDHDASSGTHNLIKQGAKLVTSVEDILEDMESQISAHERPKSGKDTPALPLTEEERHVFDRLSDRPVHIDELVHCCEPAVPVMSVLLQLELKQLVKQLPGKLFTR